MVKELHGNPGWGKGKVGWHGEKLALYIPRVLERDKAPEIRNIDLALEEQRRRYGIHVLRVVFCVAIEIVWQATVSDLPMTGRPLEGPAMLIGRQPQLLPFGIHKGFVQL